MKAFTMKIRLNMYLPSEAEIKNGVAYIKKNVYFILALGNYCLSYDPHTTQT